MAQLSLSFFLYRLLQQLSLAIFYYICALRSSSCWSGQTLLVTVGGIVRVLATSSFAACSSRASFPLASLTLSLTLGSSHSRSQQQTSSTHTESERV